MHAIHFIVSHSLGFAWDYHLPDVSKLVVCLRGLYGNGELTAVLKFCLKTMFHQHRWWLVIVTVVKLVVCGSLGHALAQY